MYKIPANTLFIGKNLVFVPECHSTNSLAQELIQQSADILEGTVVITDNQTAGRGQRGNVWEADPGKNLTLSVILRPSFLLVRDQFLLNMITSLAIVDVLKETLTAKVEIKWPNDILLKGKKLCGILVENQIQGQQVSFTVVGIGLNVNQKHFSVATAGSMSQFTNVVYNRDEILGRLLTSLERRYLQLKGKHYSVIKEEYLQNLYLLGKPSLYVSGGFPFEGTITGVDATGRLVVAAAGEQKTFDVKEIKFAG